MRKKRLGRTELMVSELGLGGIPFTRLHLEGAVSLIKHCFDQGVTFFDTAPVYGDSESKIGTALQGVREFPSRVKCATLAWHALNSAVNDNPEPATTE